MHKNRQTYVGKKIIDMLAVDYQGIHQDILYIMTTTINAHDIQCGDDIILQLLVHHQEALVKVFNNKHVVLAMYGCIICFCMSCLISYSTIPVQMYICNSQPANWLHGYVRMQIVTYFLTWNSNHLSMKSCNDYQGNSYLIKCICSHAGLKSL